MNDNPYDRPPMYPAVPVDQRPKAPRREKRGRRIKKRLMTGLLLVLLAFGAGLGGGYTAYQLWGQNPVAQGEHGGGVNLNYANHNGITPTAESGSLTAAQVLEMASESVVEVATELRSTDSFFRQYVQEGAGSGVILSADGHIVTNNHVIEGASKVTVRLKNGDSYEAEIKGYDAETDIALLKIDAENLVPAVIGRSGDLKVGDKAYVIGNPLGTLGGTVTQGIISALNREIDVDGTTMSLLQTDAAVNPGNSGGALFNDQGQLVGVIVAKSSGNDVEGLGFAIPIDEVTPVIDQLGQYGYVRGRISLGMTLLDIENQETAQMYRVSRTGVYVAKVENGSGAQKAGVQAGDCILSMDGGKVDATSDIAALVKQHCVGDTVSMVVYRNGQEITLSLTMEESMPASST